MKNKKIYAIIIAEIALLLVLAVVGGSVFARVSEAEGGDPSESTIHSQEATQETTEPPLTGWQEISGVRYYYAENGLPATGWLELDDAIYYLGNDGKMVTGMETVAGKLHFFGADGSLQTGWQIVDGNTYFFAREGAVTGWLELEEKHY